MSAKASSKCVRGDLRKPTAWKMWATAYPFELMGSHYVVWAVDEDKNEESSWSFLAKHGCDKKKARVVRVGEANNLQRKYFIQWTKDAKGMLQNMASAWVTAEADGSGVTFRLPNQGEAPSVVAIKVPVICALAMDPELRYCLLFLNHDKVGAFKKDSRVRMQPREAEEGDRVFSEKEQETKKDDPVLVSITDKVSKIYSKEWIRENQSTLLWKTRHQLAALKGRGRKIDDLTYDTLCEIHLGRVVNEEKANLWKKDIDAAQCKKCLEYLETCIWENERWHFQENPKYEEELEEKEREAGAFEAYKEHRSNLNTIHSLFTRMESTQDAVKKQMRFFSRVDRYFRNMLRKHCQDLDPTLDSWMRESTECLYHMRKAHPFALNLYKKHRTDITARMQNKLPTAKEDCKDSPCEEIRKRYSVVSSRT